MTDTSKKVSRPQIREAFLRNGARIEPDRDDLPDYVYEAAFELLEMAAPAVQGEPDVPALAEVLTSDLSARINRVSRRSLDGTVIMSSEEWNGIVELVKKLLIAAPQPAEQQPDVAQLRAAIRRLCNIYVVDDYYMGQLREERLEAAVNRAIEQVKETPK